MNNLIPPKENALVVAAAHTVLPMFLSWQKLQVIPTANCIKEIRRLHGKQTVLCLNHADRYDPVAAFALSKICGEDFYYMAARELFDQQFAGWFMQNCGAYSVVRGLPGDVPSKELTISLIAEGKRKLVEFPEGDVTGRDNEILPLKKDGLQNILEAQEHLLVKNPAEPIHVLPIAIFYEVQPDAREALETRLAHLESSLHLRSISGISIESRIRKMLVSVVENLAQHYRIPYSAINEKSVGENLLELSRIVVGRLAEFFGIETDKSRLEAEMLYDVRGELRKLASDDSSGTAYSAVLREESIVKIRECAADLDRIQQLLITASTLDQPFTNEVAWRLVDRLEEEIEGRFTIKGSRIAWMECAPPVNILEVSRRFSGDKNEAIRYLDTTVRSSMLNALLSLQNRTAVTCVLHGRCR